MVSPLARWPVILLVVLLGAPDSFGDQFTSQVFSNPQSQPPPSEGQRITASDGDTIVIEGDAQVQIIRRRPAFVRLVADADRGFVVLLVEYLNALGDTPGRFTDKSCAFTLLDGPWHWPWPDRWEGPAWLQEDGTSASDRSQVFAVETSEGTIAFVDTLPDPSAAGPTTRVHFRGSNSTAKSRRPPFDQEEPEALAMALRNAPRKPIRK